MREVRERKMGGYGGMLHIIRLWCSEKVTATNLKVCTRCDLGLVRGENEAEGEQNQFSSGYLCFSNILHKLQRQPVVDELSYE